MPKTPLSKDLPTPDRITSETFKYLETKPNLHDGWMKTGYMPDHLFVRGEKYTQNCSGFHKTVAGTHLMIANCHLGEHHSAWHGWIDRKYIGDLGVVTVMGSCITASRVLLERAGLSQDESMRVV